MPEPNTLQQWEYKLVVLKSRKRWLGLSRFITVSETLDMLQDQGLLGWEMVSERSERVQLKYIFKRPKQDK